MSRSLTMEPHFLSNVLVLFLIAGGLLVAVIVAVVVAIVLLATRRTEVKMVAPPSNLSIDLAALDLAPMLEESPTIEMYGVPVRLVVLVLAPAGRNVELPDSLGIRAICERLLPGLSRVVDIQRPIFRRWPNQLSSHGFSHTFYANMLMPGDRGIGTKWSGVAGKFDGGQGQMVAGMIFQSKQPNSIGQLTVDHQGMWNDVLRVKEQ